MSDPSAPGGPPSRGLSRMGTESSSNVSDSSPKASPSARGSPVASRGSPATSARGRGASASVRSGDVAPCISPSSPPRKQGPPSSHSGSEIERSGRPLPKPGTPSASSASSLPASSAPSSQVASSVSRRTSMSNNIRKLQGAFESTPSNEPQPSPVSASSPSASSSSSSSSASSSASSSPSVVRVNSASKSSTPSSPVATAKSATPASSSPIKTGPSRSPAPVRPASVCTAIKSGTFDVDDHLKSREATTLEVSDTEWRPFSSQAVAIHSFKANGPCQVSFTVGDKLKIQERITGWYKGIVLSNGKKGIFPMSFVHLYVIDEKDRDTVSEELVNASWEWTGLLKSYFRDGKMQEFNSLKNRLNLLMELYYSIKSNDTEEAVKLQLRHQAIEKIEEVKRLLGLDLIVRLPSGENCNESNTPIIKMLKMHQDASKREKGPKKELAKRRQKSPTCGILFDLKIFACSVGEPTQVFISLWHPEKGFLSDEFTVNLTIQGMPSDLDKIGNIKTLFKDITTADLPGSYLFARLVKIGKIDKKAKTDFRRPFGGAILPIPEVLNEREIEFTMPVFTVRNEADFWNIPNLIIRQKDVSPIQKAKGIIVGLSQFDVESDSFYRITAQPTNKRGFPEVILPGMSRNDLFITLDSGEFPEGKTFEVGVSVRLDDGEILPDCIKLGSGEAILSEYRSFVFYHNNQPHWNECINLVIPPNIFERCHLFFTIRVSSSGSTRDYGYAFLKLTKEDGTITDDGVHPIQVFKHPKVIEDPLYYLNDPSKITFIRGGSLQISTYLSSTILTQNSSMYALLKWQKHQNKLPELLNRFTFVEKFEIVKFFQETFNAMFQILDSKIEGVKTLVYDAIVFVIGIITDEKTTRFTNFKPVLETYISKHFHGRTAHIDLLECLTNYIENMSNKPQQVLPSLKALRFLFQFIIQSLRLEKSDRPDFSKLKPHFHNLFQSFNQFMSKTDPTLIGAQTLCLKNLNNWLEQLTEVFTTQELANICSSFVNSVNNDPKSKISITKLDMMCTIIKAPLFNDKPARTIVSKLLLDTLNVHFLGSQAESKKCTEILEILISDIDTDPENRKESSLDRSIVSLLPSVCRSLELLRDDEDYLLLSITCVLAISFMVTPKQFFDCCDNLEPPKKTEFIKNLSEMVYWFVEGKTYPKNWFAMVMFQHRVSKRILALAGKVLDKRINDNWNDEETKMWISFFQATLAYLDSSVLKLETCSASKASTIKDAYGDMRLSVCAVIKAMWARIGKNQAVVVQSLVKDFLRCALVDQKEISTLGVDLYFSAMEREFTATKSFKQIESQTIEAFSGAVASTDSRFSDGFFEAIEKKVRTIPSMLEAGTKFVHDLHELCRIVALRSMQHGDEHEDDRTIATLRLMEYFKESNRMDSYIRYVQVLHESFIKGKCPAKAGMILKLHSDLLSWSETDTLHELAGFPAESSFDRKKRLYLMMIDHLEEGQMWERAIELAEELAAKLAARMDYLGAADLLEHLARIYRKVMQDDRLPPEYFRVGYYGRGFPSNVRAKEFIFHGQPLERLQDFIERVQSKFPYSELLKTTEPPGPDITNSDGQYIQIFSVKPVQDPDVLKKYAKVPAKVRTFNEYVNINKFVYRRPFGKDKAKSKKNEFLDLWTMEYLYETKHTFPVATDRSEIVKTSESVTTPIQNAVLTLQAKNEELIRFQEEYSDGKSENLGSFTRVLSGTIDAAVGGGMEKYKQAFCTPEYLAENPSDAPYVAQLGTMFDNQLKILTTCIEIHARVCPPQIKNLQMHLEETLAKLIELDKNPPSQAPSQPQAAPVQAPPSPTVSSHSQSPSSPSSGFSGASPSQFGGEARQPSGFLRAQGTRPKREGLTIGSRVASSASVSEYHSPEHPNIE